MLLTMNSFAQEEFTITGYILDDLERGIEGVLLDGFPYVATTTNTGFYFAIIPAGLECRSSKSFGQILNLV